MKQIRISAKLDKSGFQKELNQLLKKGYDLNLNLNGGNFKSVANDISKELNKLKNTLNNINGNTFNNASDGIRKTKDAVKDLNSELARPMPTLRIIQNLQGCQVKIYLALA